MLEKLVPDILKTSSLNQEIFEACNEPSAGKTFQVGTG